MILIIDADIYLFLMISSEAIAYFERFLRHYAADAFRKAITILRYWLLATTLHWDTPLLALRLRFRHDTPHTPDISLTAGWRQAILLFYFLHY